mgnify:CR=1 FL=1
MCPAMRCAASWPTTKAISSALRASAISATVKMICGRPALSIVWNAFGGRPGRVSMEMRKSQSTPRVSSRQMRSATGSTRFTAST